MTELTTFIRSSGNGENIVCLHSCLGSSKQWTALMARLEDSFLVNATDLYGHGKGPNWTQGQALTLDAEVDLISALLDDMAGPIHLVGHSYGAAVAIKVAQRYADKIQSLTVYEPVLFTLLFAAGQTHCSASEIFWVIDDMQQDYNAGNSAYATRRFIDYWSGKGAWDRFTPELQENMAARAGTVLANFKALLAERGVFAMLTNLDLPTLCLYGEKSPSTTREIASILGEVMPNVEIRQLPGMGHMGPVTHSDRVNDHIEGFLRNQQPDYQRAA